jgi:hypothetical protein
MGHDLLFHALLLLGLLWLCVILIWVWPPRRTATGQADGQFAKRAKTRHTKDPKLFPGLTTKPCCPGCEHAPLLAPPAPLLPAATAELLAWASTSGGYLRSLLPQCTLSQSWLGGAWEYPGQRPSRWRALAAVAGHRLPPVFPGDPRHAVPWEARVGRTARVSSGFAG